MKMNFEGESIEVLMQDDTGDNYYNVLIDEDSVVLTRPSANKKYITLASKM